MHHHPVFEFESRAHGQARPRVLGSRLARAAVLAALSVAALTAQATGHFQRLKSFGFPDELGQYPQAPVVLGSDGTLYGTTSGGGSNDVGTVFKVNPDGSAYAVLHVFGPGGPSRQPQAGLLEGSDGVLYGTTWSGGHDNLGTIFRLNKDGSGYVVLHSFTGSGGDGKQAAGELVEGDDGALYGTTAYGGSGGMGTVFKLNKDGSDYTILRSFTFRVGNNDAGDARAGLTKGSDGVLYGTTQQGGRSGVGAVFRINQDGSGYAVLYSFGQTVNDGYGPRAPLVEGTDGALYGTAAYGASGAIGPLGVGNGTVFKLAKDGSGYTILHRFTMASGDGAEPLGGLTEGADGSLYGTAAQGGTNSLGGGSGVVFNLRKDGTAYRILHTFGFPEGDGGRPAAGLFQDHDGILYGTTQISGATTGTVFKMDSDGSGYQNLVRFNEGGGDGIRPRAGLREGSDGALYGVTTYGGRHSLGTLFRLNKDGSGYGLLHHFPSFAGDGYRPADTLLEANDGTLYGSTPCGGSSNLGTVFRMNKDGSGYSVLQHFSHTPGTGFSYGAPVVLGHISGGALYGTTATLGARNMGTVFKMNLDGSEFRILHDFGDLTAGDGGRPQSGVFEASDGALFGTTMMGGTNLSGTVFRINNNGTDYRVIHHFGPLLDGHAPRAGVIEGRDGALYGTSESGGAQNGGTVFKVNKDGTGFAVLHSLTRADGTRPAAALVEGNDGLLYGSTSSGGSSSPGGTLFRLKKDGTGFAVLYEFIGSLPGSISANGAHPFAPLILGSDGAFYGTTSSRGDMGFPGFGTAFRLSPPETPSLTGLNLARDAVEVTCAGMPGCTYELMRSTDLTNWTVLTTVTMPESGSNTVVDNHSPGRTACYRAKWRQ